jgi:hypothetical protein
MDKFAYMVRHKKTGNYYVSNMKRQCWQGCWGHFEKGSIWLTMSGPRGVMTRITNKDDIEIIKFKLEVCND